MEPPPSYKENTTFGNVFLWKKVAAIECYLGAKTNGIMVAVGTRISPRPPPRSRRPLLTHRAPPSGQTSCDERFSHVRRPTHSHHSDRRGISAQCPNRGRLTAVPLGGGPSLHDFRREFPPLVQSLRKY